MEGRDSSVYREISSVEDFRALKKPLFSHLFEFTKLKDEFQKFLYQEGLLGDFSGPCEKCPGGQVRFGSEGKSCSTGQPRFAWRCNNRSCRRKLSTRHASLFQGSMLSERTIMLLVYCFANKIPQHIVMNSLIDLATHTMVDWYRICRDLCCEILLADNKKIGGPGHVVEIDASKFGKGKDTKVGGFWVLGGIDRQTNETFFKVVSDHSPETLLSVVLDNVLPETTVISVSWESYINARDDYFSKYAVDHSINFVSPGDHDAHTDTIESQWSILRKSVLPKHGTKKDLYGGYFSTYCVQKRYLDCAPCPFWAFLELIKRVFPLESRPTAPAAELLSQPKRVRSGSTTFRSIAKQQKLDTDESDSE
ncbi:uncharacterized protein LOC135223322 [Macrobrachium nipponense]|uniref:uncharacterized protein LOC135223322 n=1 Tax=Macrobrachium nipponense TaxID=159736 RepID=UPI0030C89A12